MDQEKLLKISAKILFNDLQEIMWLTNNRLMNWYEEAEQLYKQTGTNFYNEIYGDGYYYKDSIPFEGEQKPICPRKEDEDIKCHKSHVGECYRRRLNMIKAYDEKYEKLRSIRENCRRYIQENKDEILAIAMEKIENPDGEIEEIVSNAPDWDSKFFQKLLGENYLDLFLTKSKHYKNLIEFSFEINKQNNAHKKFIEINESKLLDKDNNCYNLLKSSEEHWQDYWNCNSHKISKNYTAYPEKWIDIWGKMKRDVEISPPFEKVRKARMPNGMSLRDIIVLAKYYNIALNQPIAQLVQKLIKRLSY